MQEGKYKREAQKLKEEVLWLVAEIENPLAKLELIDSINKMSLSHLFDKEIMVFLQNMEFAKKLKDSGVEMDLYSTALYFRIFRQYGYNVTQGTDVHKYLRYFSIYNMIFKLKFHHRLELNLSYIKFYVQSNTIT